MTAAPACAPLVCVLHPSSDVRVAILAVLPAGTLVASAATPSELPGAPAQAPVVVLLDPALTAPAEAVAAFATRPTVVSLSELRLPLAELGVDHQLPLSRVTEGAVLRLLLHVGLRPVLAGSGL